MSEEPDSTLTGSSECSIQKSIDEAFIKMVQRVFAEMLRKREELSEINYDE